MKFIQPGFIPLVPAKKLPEDLQTLANRESGTYPYYSPTRPGVGVAARGVRPTATLLLGKGGTMQRVRED